MRGTLFAQHRTVRLGMWLSMWVATAGASGVAVAAPYVEFDFARSAECHDVTPAECIEPYANRRLVELRLPVSVRFHGVAMEDVEELDIEINGAAAGLRVVDFWPATRLASDIAQQIETTTTTKRGRSIDGTLGGGLPVPYAGLVAHVSPSINAGISGSETATEKTNRLPPKQAIVVSGTSSEGRGVFFKIKRSSQTSLEGVHELAVTFAVPADWQGDEVRVGCSARGRRALLWIKQPATLGRAAGNVRLHLVGSGPVHHVAKPVQADDPPTGPTAFLAAAAANVIDLMNPHEPHDAAADRLHEHPPQD